MHAFVSSRYVVIEHVSLRRWRLLATFRHEGFSSQPIEFCKPCRNIREHRFYQHTSSGAANPDAVAFEPELAWQTHGLASPILEELSGSRHRLLLI
jgi:hypothetical protein